MLASAKREGRDINPPLIIFIPPPVLAHLLARWQFLTYEPS